MDKEKTISKTKPSKEEIEKARKERVNKVNQGKVITK